MIARFSEGRARLRAAAEDQRGAILIFVVVSLAVMMGATGLAVDLGRGYVERVRLSRAVDAAALAAARVLRSGQPAAITEGNAVARSNGVTDGINGVATSVTFDVNAQGENTVTYTANRQVPTIFIRFLGQTSIDVGVTATSTIPPVDLVLVLDESGSLGTAGAWDDLQAAATTFVQQFDDLIDQVALVSFQTRANTWNALAHNFTSPIVNQIALLQSGGYTNPGEGLRLAGIELAGTSARPSAAKVVVFFTDGRPTAFRGVFGNPGMERDRIGRHAQLPTSSLRGYFNDPDAVPMTGSQWPSGCMWASSCFGMTDTQWRNMSYDSGLASADALRDEDVLIYSIGLGDPSIGAEYAPDPDYLRMIANEGGVSDPAQPQGQMFFAPSAADLAFVFNQVATALLVRLSH
ncbi:MAG: VWA domain-containing protein [Gemmatimonadetes bacterium]|nr:VWA domain-containing protein [Gemmatimonadota bacterium]